MNVFLRYWLPWYAWLAAIFAVSCLSHPDQTFGVTVKDLVAHPLEYFFLTLLTFRAFRQSRRPFLKENFFAAGVFFCAIYGITDEIHQIFVPHRTACLSDWALDLCGIAAGALFFSVSRRTGRV